MLQLRNYFVGLVCLLGCLDRVLAEDAAPVPQPHAAAPFRIVGYLPDYRLSGYDFNRAAGVTELILFSAEVTDTSELSLSRLKDTPWEKLQAAAKQHNFKVVVCVGGWQRGKHFATATATAANRQRLIKSALQICQDYKLAGLDFDWEYPANATEAENYIALLTELREAFTPHKLQLTAAVSAEQLNLRQIGEAVDYLNLMSYDHDERHATLEDARSDLERLRDAEVPAGKITLGVPFYARGIKERSRMLGYGQVVDSFDPAPDVNEVDHLYFNGVNLIRQKTEYAIANELAGVMIWELAFDAAGEHALLPVIHKTIAEKIAN